MVDVVVIGAGIIGLAAALGLSERGLSVVVVDREAPGAGASGVAAGMLAALCEAPELPDPLLVLAAESARAWPAFAAHVEAASGRSCDLRREGTLVVAMDRDELVEIERATRILARQGMAYTPLTVAEVHAREPRLHPRLAGGFAASDDHNVDPQATVAALVAALQRRGVVILRHAVERLEDDGVVRVIAGGAVVATGARALIAAGAWSASLAAPWLDLPMTPVKGQVVVLEGEVLLTSVVRTPKVYLVPRAGRLVLGASMEEQGFDQRPIAGVVMGLLREAWRALPGTYELHIAELRTGLRPMLADAMPALGPLSERVFLATGHHRHGVLLAAASTDRVVAGMCEGRWDPDFLPSRFTAARARAPR